MLIQEMLNYMKKVGMETESETVSIMRQRWTLVQKLRSLSTFCTNVPQSLQRYTLEEIVV